MNVTADLIHQAALRPDAPALVSVGRSMSYAKLDLLAWLAAGFLSESGLRRGDSVALTFVDDFLLAVAMLGSARLGLTFVPIPKRATIHQRRGWASAAGCRALVSDAPERFETGLPAVRLDAGACAAGRRVPRALFDETPRAPLMINVGSGSTGAPKLIPVTHANMACRSRVSADSPVFAQDDRTLWASGLEFTAVQNRLFNQLHVGMTLMLLPPREFDLPEFIRTHGVTVLVASVFHLESLLRTRGASGSPALAALRAIRTGGSNVTDSLRTRVRERLNPNLFVKYATNETGVVSVCLPDGHAEVSGSIGRPLAGIDLEVRAPAGEVGEVRIRNPGVIAGYLGDEESTRTRFVDGWFQPGDLAAESASGAFVYYGRVDHMMIVNGINLYPAEIETCLAGHPAVADVAALPLDHPVHQHIPVCAVALRDGAAVGPGELDAFARERLGARSPVRIATLPRIPRTPQGKLDRSELLATLRALR